MGLKKYLKFTFLESKTKFGISNIFRVGNIFWGCKIILSPTFLSDQNCFYQQNYLKPIKDFVATKLYRFEECFWSVKICLPQFLSRKEFVSCLISFWQNFSCWQNYFARYFFFTSFWQYWQKIVSWQAWVQNFMGWYNFHQQKGFLQSINSLDSKILCGYKIFYQHYFLGQQTLSSPK